METAVGRRTTGVLEEFRLHLGGGERAVDGVGEGASGEAGRRARAGAATGIAPGPCQMANSEV